MRAPGPLDSYLHLLNRAGARIATAFNDEDAALGATLQICACWRRLRAQTATHGRPSDTLDRGLALTRLFDNMEQRAWARRRDAGDARAIRLHVASGRPALTQRILPIAERYEMVALPVHASETETLKAALRRCMPTWMAQS